MRWTLAILFFAASTSSAATFDLYFLGGQSNMDGYGRRAELPGALNVPVANAWIYHGDPQPDGAHARGAGEWAPLEPGHGVGFRVGAEGNELSDRFGVELSFARRLLEERDGPVALIKYSKGGTSIAAEAAQQFGSWDPDFRDGAGAPEDNNQYDHFLATVWRALAVRDIDGDGIEDTLVPRGIVWMQGESDASFEASAAVYDANLRRLLDLMRAALRVDDLPAVIGRISDSGADEDGSVWDWGRAVRARQVAVAAADPATTLVLGTDRYDYSDPYHYDSGAYLDLGRRFASALLQQERVRRVRDALDDQPFRLERLAEDLYVTRTAPGTNPSAHANSLIVVDPAGVLVVDSRGDAESAARLVETVRGLTGQPVLWLVNTHWHSDHVAGNEVFRRAFPGVHVIGQRRMAEELATVGAARKREDAERLSAAIAQRRQWLEVGARSDGTPLTAEERQALPAALDRAQAHLDRQGGWRIVVPDTLVDSELRLPLANREVRLLHWRAAHTGGDLVVDLPDDDLLYVGDLLEAGQPFLGDGDPWGWALVLGELERLDREILVLSHGWVEVGGTLLRQQKEFLEAVLLAVSSLPPRTDADETVRRAPVGALLDRAREFAQGADRDFVEEAIRRAVETRS